MKNDPCSCECNLCNCVRSLKKKIRTSTGFEPMISRCRCGVIVGIVIFILKSGCKPGLGSGVWYYCTSNLKFSCYFRHLISDISLVIIIRVRSGEGHDIAILSTI